MSFINKNAKEIHCKIVYYGPSLGGKTTNIQWIYQKTATDQKSKLIALNANNERTLFFDFLPLHVGDIRGYKARFHLFAVPGQVVSDPYRKLILKGLDGVVFVADSQKERMEENIESFKNLKTNLRQQGYDIEKVPLVIQYNKRDLNDAVSIQELRYALNQYNSPDFEAVASTGDGVEETFKTIAKKIITILRGND